MTDTELLPVHKRCAELLAERLYVPGTGGRKGVVSEVAEILNVSRQTIHNWMKLDGFYDCCESYMSKYDNAAKDGLYQLLDGSLLENGPNASIVRWYHENRWPEGFDGSLRRLREKHHMDIELQKLANEGIKDAAAELPQVIIQAAKPVSLVPKEIEDIVGDSLLED